MKKMLFFLAATTAAGCFANLPVTVSLTYHFSNRPYYSYTDTLVVGPGGKEAYDEYDGSTYYMWEFPTRTGLDFRFKIEVGYPTYTIGTGTGNYAAVDPAGAVRLDFGETYELNVGGTLANVFVSTTPYYGKKITNMTKSDIKIGLFGHSTTIPKDSAVFLLNDFIPSIDATGVPVTRVDDDVWNPSWEVHSEQDWSKTYTPIYKYNMYDFPIFANLVFYEPSVKPPIHKVAGALVYGDMKSLSGGKALFGSGGQPLYSAKDIIDAFTVMTEWVFDQTQDNGPTARINGDNVCVGHSTSHIIDYSIATIDNWRYDKASNCYLIDFSMQLLAGSLATSSYQVEQRCWIADYATYAEAPAGKSASASVEVGATTNFRASLNKTTGEQHLTLL